MYTPTPGALRPAASSLSGADVSPTATLLRQAPPAAQPLLRGLLIAQARHALLPANATLVVAVSGGADSMALLHALHQLAPAWQLRLHVAHLDHNLRADAAADATFVAAWAAAHGLPCTVEQLAPAALDRDPRGLEAAARAARYAFLARVAQAVGPRSLVATAHHQNDQAETLLLHLIQGSGLDGLAGMAWRATLPNADSAPPVPLVRPLLGISRSHIHAYLRAYDTPWREDSTNTDTNRPRARLRHVILPALADLNPAIHATLARTAELLASEADHAAQRDQRAWHDALLAAAPATRVVLDGARLHAHDRATQRGILRHALAWLGADLRSHGPTLLDPMVDALHSPLTASGPHPLAEGWAWTILAGTPPRLALHRGDALPQAVAHPHLAAPLPALRPLPPTGVQSVTPAWQLVSDLLTPTDLPADWRADPWQLYCDHDAAGDLALATPRPGMRIAPLGMRGHHRTLGDLFTDTKIAPALRPGWPVVVDANGEVVWLCGLRVHERIRVRVTTRQVRRLRWQPAP